MPATSATKPARNPLTVDYTYTEIDTFDIGVEEVVDWLEEAVRETVDLT